MTLPLFHPFDQLAAKLLDNLMEDEDGAHDLSHIVRVWRNAHLIQREEGGDLEVVAAAVLLHDCVQVAKDSPERSQASLLAANESRIRLTALGWEPSRIHYRCLRRREPQLFGWGGADEYRGLHSARRRSSRRDRF